MVLQNWIGSKLYPILARVGLGEVDNLNYLISYIAPCAPISNEFSSHIHRPRLVFIDLMHLWCRLKIRLSIRGRIRRAAVRFVPL